MVVKGRRAQLAQIRKLKSRGDALFQEKKWEESAEVYEECVEVFEAVERYFNAELKFAVFQNLGTAFFETKNLEKSEEFFSRAIDEMAQKREKLQ